MVDAYQDITFPFQMSSTEFFTMVRQHLNPGRVMVVNMNMISDGEGSINEALTGTIASVFGRRNILTADVPVRPTASSSPRRPAKAAARRIMIIRAKAPAIAASSSPANPTRCKPRHRRCT